MNKITIKDILKVLETIQAPQYSMGIPKIKREKIGYSVVYAYNGISVKLRGNRSTKKYQKVLEEWGEKVKETLIQAFGSQVTCFSLNDFLIKETVE